MKVRAGAPRRAGGLPSAARRASPRASARVPSAGTSLPFAVRLLASGLAGAAWREHLCEIVRIELNGLEVLGKWC